MPIDQASLNSLLTTLMPKDNMTVLRERRASLLQNLQDRKDNGNNEDGHQVVGDAKKELAELAEVDQRIAQEVYDETTRKLEEERLKLEEAFAKKERDRERLLAKHERLLENRSMSKLLSAAIKANHPGSPYIGDFNSGRQGDNAYVSEVERDLHESVQYGIAAAEVAARRKNAETKAQIEEAAEKKQKAYKQRMRRINIKV